MKAVPIILVLGFLSNSFSSATATTAVEERNLRHRRRNAQLSVEHTIFESRIVGGSTASINDYPFFVNWGGCGASLIGKEWVLTAAHCDVIPYEWLKVNQSRQTGSQGLGTTHYIEKRVPHPQYDRSTVRNDFMLMKLSTAVSDSIPPIDLNDNSAVPSNNQDLTVIGFGKLQSGGSSASDLQEVTVQYVPTSECNAGVSYGGDIDETMMCAGVDGGGKDSCQGDSGGPIFTSDNNGKFTQVGVVSWGYGCAEPNHPGVYARISQVIDWMKDTVCDDTEYPPDFCNNNNNGGGSNPTRPPTIPPTNAPTRPPTSAPMSPIVSPTRVPTIPPTSAAIVPTTNTNVGSGSVQVTLVFQHDDFPDENSWEFIQGGQVVASGDGSSASPGELKTYYYQINPGPTSFTIMDTHLDGICCGHGLGNYQIEANNLVLNDSNGEFGEEETLVFTISSGDDNNDSSPTPVPPSSCSDSSDEQFLVDNDVGNQGCEWLKTNTANFGYLCKFFDVAIACKQTCDVCRYFE